MNTLINIDELELTHKWAKSKLKLGKVVRKNMAIILEDESDPLERLKIEGDLRTMDSTMRDIEKIYIKTNNIRVALYN